MGRARWALGIAAATATAAAACSLLVDSDNLVGGRASDAGSGAEAATDASGGDAPFIGDGGGPDGSTDGAKLDAGSRFCTAFDAALYCADFDEDAGLGTYGPSTVTDAGLLELATDTVTSPPRSLRAVTNRAGGSTQRARINTTLAATYSRIRVSFSVRADTNAPDDELIVNLDLGAYDIGLQVGPNLAKVDEALPVDAGTAIDHVLARGYTLGTWARYVMELKVTRGDAGPTASTVRVDMDGVQVLPDTPVEAYRYMQPTFALEYGLVSVTLATGETWTVHLDDIVVEVF